MRVKDVLRAPKSGIDWGKWHQEKMPASAFPLKKGKRRAYMLPASWRWRIVKFDAVGHSFRVLIAYRPDLEEFKALLGLDQSGDTTVLVDLAYHGTHPGWHAHSWCAPFERAVSGVMRYPGLRRIPGGRRPHRATQYVSGGGQMNDAYALQIIVERFNIAEAPGPLFSNNLKGGDT